MELAATIRYMLLNRKHYSPAFALPTVLIASVVMMLLLTVTLASVGSITASINAQYYNKLAKEAAEAGLTMAKACIANGTSTPTWSNTSPLRPNTDCGGGVACSTDTPSCYVLSNGNARTTFSVGTATFNSDGSYTIPVNGTVQLLRSSNGAVWQSYNQNITGVVKFGWTQVTLGINASYTCGISVTAQAYCWGKNDYGQLGNGSNSDAYVPTPVYTGGVLKNLTIKAISAGGNITCVIASDDNAYCWGYNYYGSLGDGQNTASNVPVAVTNSGALRNKTVKQIAVGIYGACVVASDNNAYCWGFGNGGRIGDNSGTSSYVPSPVYTGGALAGKTVKQVSLGEFGGCVVASDNNAYCWGATSSGSLGNGVASTTSNAPVAVTTTGALSGKTIKQLVTGFSDTCVIASDNKAYCWGFGSNGELGSGTASSSSVPIAVSVSGVLSGKTITGITHSGQHGCVITADNQMACWGGNGAGQLGTSSFITSSLVPVAVDTSGALSGKTLASASAGRSTTCALSSSNQMYCWGWNADGNYGNGTNSGSRTPVVGGTQTALSY